jgi:hypothetical protein
MRSTLRRVTFSLAVAVTLALGMGSPPVALAVGSRTTCTNDYMWCMTFAVNDPDNIRYIAKALDCSVDYVACVRRSIFG